MFWIEEMKLMIRAVPIAAARKIITQDEDIVLEMPLERLYVRPFSLAMTKFLPGTKNIFKTNNPLKYAAHI